MLIRRWKASSALRLSLDEWTTDRHPADLMPGNGVRLHHYNLLQYYFTILHFYFLLITFEFIVLVPLSLSLLYFNHSHSISSSNLHNLFFFYFSFSPFLSRILPFFSSHPSLHIFNIFSFISLSNLLNYPFTSTHSPI